MKKFSISRRLMKRIVEEEKEEFKDRWRVNHEDCPSGTDLKRRLYVERKDYGIVSHCFNCGGSGYVPLSSVDHKSAAKSAAYARARHHPTHEPCDVSRIRIAGDATQDISEWSREARAYILKFGIKQEEIDEHKISYSHYRNAIIYPIYKDGELVGYSQRNFNEGMPKYLSRMNEGAVGWTSPYKPTSMSALVITEDVLSAIKCARLCYSMALLRTTISPHMLAHVCDLFEAGAINRAFVHLDNDNPMVRRNAVSIVDRIQFLGIPCSRIKVEKDPKKCSMDELRGYYDRT